MGKSCKARSGVLHIVNPAQSKDHIRLVPSEFQLSQNYPNPFSEKTAIKFCVAYRTRVTLEVLDSEGKMVRTLLDEERNAGTYEIEFVAGGESFPAGHGGAMSEGIYLYKLQAGEFSETKKMVMLRQGCLASAE